ncbi:MAG: hypothetical protein V2A61_07420 [Calditrichota bacterium]
MQAGTETRPTTLIPHLSSLQRAGETPAPPISSLNPSSPSPSSSPSAFCIIHSAFKILLAVKSKIGYI